MSEPRVNIKCPCCGDLYNRLKKAEAELDWLKDQLAEVNKRLAEALADGQEETS